MSEEFPAAAISSNGDIPAQAAPPAAAESLPPVEAPNAGFIVKLFVIPFIIVSIIVGVWASIYWLANMDDDPWKYVNQLKRNDESRWQAAHNLATLFQRTGNEKYRKDAQLLGAVVSQLEAENAKAGTDDSSVKVRMYLCMAVGEYHLPEALPPLVTTLEKNRRGGVKEVRLAAMLGIARLAPFIPEAEPAANAELRTLIDEAAEDSEPVVRSHAAYVLFPLGDERAIRKLEALVNDGDVDVRMNAAIKLAQLGRTSCLTEISRMLDPAESEALTATEKSPEKGMREAKRTKIYEEALEAAKQYHHKAPQADVTPLVEALDKLLATNPPDKLRLAAEDVRREILAPAKSQ